MEFDVEAELREVSRSVGKLELDGKPARSVSLSRLYETAIDDLWNAATEAARISIWFAPITGELKLGGRYQIEGNAGGSIKECRPPSGFSLTWEFGEDVSSVDARLVSQGEGQTLAEVTHASVLSPHWETYGPGAVGVGWEMALLGLAIHIGNPQGSRIDPVAFLSSPKGRDYTFGSSDGWVEADVASGTAPETAKATARRTAAFYLGEDLDDQ